MFNNSNVNDTSSARRNFNIASAVLAIGLTSATCAYGVFSLFSLGEKSEIVMQQHCDKNPQRFYCPK